MSARSHLPAPWLDTAAAAVPGVAAAWSAALLAPLFDVAAGLASPLAGIGVFGAGWLLMRAASPRLADFELRAFGSPVGPDELPHDDPLPVPGADSRVVQLFPAPHPGLETVSGSGGQTDGDAADSLRRALDDLRQTLARS